MFQFASGFEGDYLYDASGTDQIEFLEGISAQDVRLMRSGYDLMVYVGTTDSIFVANQFYDLQNNTSSYGEVESIKFANLATIDLLGSLVFTGTSNGESLEGTKNSDTLIGKGGYDSIYGYEGNDTFVFGDDTGESWLYDNAGADKIEFTPEIDRSDIRFETSGNNLIIHVGTNQNLYVQNHLYDVMNTTSLYNEIETVLFSDGTTVNLLGTLTFEGTSGGEGVYGTNNADILNGLGGYDSLYGKLGDDTYLFDSGFEQDFVYDTGGTDTIKLAGIFTTENINLADHSSYSTQIAFTSYSDVIYVDAQRAVSPNGKIEFLEFADGFKADLLTYSTWVWGTSSAQTTNGTANADTIFGRGGNDTINGDDGNDAIHGGSGADTLSGGNGDDQLNGGIGNDTLNGGANDDILFGGDGLDSLTGSTGADTFVFTPDSAFNNIDLIIDFSTAQSDKINLLGVLEQYNPLADAITDFVQISTSGSHSLLNVDVDGGGNNFIQIATLYGVTGLTDEEALVANGTLIVGDGVASGLFASHYATASNISFLSQIDWTATPAHTQVVTSINQTGNSSTPFFTGGPTDYFAVSYEGHLNVVTAGTYTFNLASDDGSALWIDGAELIDNDGLHSAGTDSASVYLTAGLHELEAHYFEATGDQIMKLEWSGADTGNAMQVIGGNSLQNEGTGVNIKPVAGNDIVNTYVEVPVNILVLGNDKDDDGDDYDITSVTQGAHGSVTINQNGTLTYTPTTDYYGLDSFTYTITDINGGTDTATVDVTVIDDSNSISENFESGASGWSNNTTNDTSTTFTEFLGRFAGATSGQDTSKTFTLSGDQSHITVAFDFYKIDSWDNEAFEIYVDDTLVVSNIFGSGSAGSGSGSFSGGSWERTAVSVGNLGFNAYGADWNDGIYHYELTLAVTDTNVKLGFGSALNESYVENESWGIDNLLIEEEQEFGAPGTYLHKENFEGGVAGWSDTQTDDSAAGALTTFLGRFTGNASGQDTAKTFALSGDQSTITIGFDFYKIDSWDNEAFEVYLNDTLVFTNSFSGSSSGSSSGTFTGGSWERTAVNVGNLGYGAYGTDWNDGIYHYKITLNTTSSTLKVGFGSALDETNVLNESWGIDNLSLGEDLVSGTSSGETLNGASVGELIYGFDGNDTLNGKGGEDHLYGGAGEDTFVFEAATAFSNIDQIHDFSLANDDKIDLSDVLQGYDPLTDAITDFVQFTTSGANSILKVDADGGANNFVQIALLNNVTGLTDEAALVTNGHLIAA